MPESKRLRVMFVLPSLNRAGAETQLVNLVTRLDRAHFEPHVFTFERHLHQLDKLKSANVPHHHHLRKSKYDFAYTRALAELIDSLEIDVIHCSLQFALLAGWLARRYSKRKPQLVAAIHTTVNRSLKEELQDRLLYRWLLQGCSRVIFVCEAQRAYWMTRYPALRPFSVTIYNGIDHERFKPTPEIELEAASLREKLGISPDAVVITSVAGFRPEKRHDLLLNAFERLPEDTHLLLAGEGQTRAETEKRVQSAGLDSRVHFLGAVADIRPVLAASTATVLASTAVETFSMAVLESMAMEVPVIVPDLSGLPEAVTENKTGFVYPTGNLDALAKSLNRMNELDASTRKTMGKSARKRLLDYFTEQHMVEKTELLLKQVVEESVSRKQAVS